MSQDAAKAAAGRHAARMVQDGMKVGLGTGSTAAHMLEALAERVRDDGLEFTGVPTSRATEEAARALDLPLSDLHETPVLDLALDGADQVDPDFHMIKGGGGAHLHEKIVAAAAETVVIMVDPGKLVEQLGGDQPLPVEVSPFAGETVLRDLRATGCEPTLRRGEDGEPFVTDGGHHVADCLYSDPLTRHGLHNLEAALNRIPGVLGTGLFLDLCDLLIVGAEDGSTELRSS